MLCDICIVQDSMILNSVWNAIANIEEQIEMLHSISYCAYKIIRGT